MILREASGRTVPILLVEDDDIDIEAVRRTLKSAEIENPVHVAHDGVEALDMLYGRTGAAKITLPCVILLDINLPRMDGLQFLEVRSGGINLKQSIVFILTTSDRHHDKMRAYELNIAGYLLKHDLSKLAGLLSNYLEINRFPDGHF